MFTANHAQHATKTLSEDRPFTPPESVEKVNFTGSMVYNSHPNRMGSEPQAQSLPMGTLDSSKVATASDELGTGYEEDSEASSAA
ncbi:hypothetical protein L7F22_060354 [Adiantum nelumboides]|nr:hypothetical protein [Adiantum nelumboides]